MTTQTAEQSLTHHVRLVLDNDYALYQNRLALVERSAAQSAEWVAEYGIADDDGNVRASLLADALKDWCEELADIGETENMLAGEILTTALAHVDWLDMARGYLAE